MPCVIMAVSAKPILTCMQGEKDDEKAISGIAEKFKGTYFANQNQNQNQNDGEPPIRGNGGTTEPQIKVDRSTPLKDLFKRK